jgi:hypothetical protein
MNKYRFKTIFIATEETLTAFASQIEELLDIQTEKTTYYDSKERYDYYGEKGWFILYRHTLINEEGANFQDYNYEIELRVTKSNSWEEHIAILNEFSFPIYENLKATKKYTLMFMDGIDIKLDEYNPNFLS